MFHMRVGFFFEVLYELCMLRGRGSCYIERGSYVEARPGGGILEEFFIS